MSDKDVAEKLASALETMTKRFSAKNPINDDHDVAVAKRILEEYRATLPDTAPASGECSLGIRLEILESVAEDFEGYADEDGLDFIASENTGEDADITVGDIRRALKKGPTP